MYSVGRYQYMTRTRCKMVSIASNAAPGQYTLITFICQSQTNPVDSNFAKCDGCLVYYGIASISRRSGTEVQQHGLQMCENAVKRLTWEIRRLSLSKYVRDSSRKAVKSSWCWYQRGCSVMVRRWLFSNRQRVNVRTLLATTNYLFRINTVLEHS